MQVMMGYCICDKAVYDKLTADDLYAYLLSLMTA